MWHDDLVSKTIPIPNRPDDSHDKHSAMLEAIAPYAKNKVQGNLTDIKITTSTKKTKILFLLMPEWAINFPPYNLARLSAVCKVAGYESKCLDLNVKSWNYYKENLTSTIDFDPWSGSRDWCWIGDQYYTYLHPHFESFFNKYIEEIVKFNPDVVGFTLYYCNNEPVKWMAAALKKQLPNLKIIVGGPQMQSRPIIDSVFDCGIMGEGELILLEILDEIENNNFNTDYRLRYQPEEQRLNLNSLPIPDYSDIDFNEYAIPNGINSELSRGCTAKCTFCEETHFWKYRQRQAVDVIQEIETLYYTNGTDVVWFLDSLVNGNLNELRAFAKGIIAKGIKIKWVGYCRNDGRMNAEYYKDLADSGCFMLSYGCESASQRVLDDIAKGTTTADMEQNFRDGYAVGIKAHTNWIVGFPTERYQDFADTITFIWRNRNNGIVDIAPGFGYGLSPATIVGQNPDRFNLLHHKYMNTWITKDFKLGKLHVLSRIKSFAIFLQQLITKNPIATSPRPNLEKFHYALVWQNPTTLKEIEYENFNYDIIKCNINPFADSLVNEMFVLFRMLWRIRGGYRIKVIFDETLDMQEFGDRNAAPYWSTHEFLINDRGQWTAKFKWKFKQPESIIDPPDPLTPRAPFFAQDYSTMQNNNALRAKKLAKPEWGSQGRTHEDFKKLMEEEKYLNENMNFSFTHEWEGSGDWSNFEKYFVEPSQGSKKKIVPIVTVL